MRPRNNQNLRDTNWTDERNGLDKMQERKGCPYRFLSTIRNKIKGALKRVDTSNHGFIKNFMKLKGVEKTFTV